MTRYLTALGDVTDPHFWSGTGYYLWEAGLNQHFFQHAHPIDLRGWTGRKWLWNAAQVLKFKQRGGYQYSSSCLERLSHQLPTANLKGQWWTLNQMFPPAGAIKKAGGELCYYIDATMHSLLSGKGLSLQVDPGYAKDIIAREKAGYQQAKHLVTMARWTRDSLVNDYGIPESKIAVILPGANLPANCIREFPVPTERPGIERPFVLGFVGKDWQRKGLPLLLEVRDDLEKRGWKVLVKAAGNAPKELQQRKGLEFVGFLDKQRGIESFVQFLQECDIGCLFSRAEALGISVLEFLHAGIPVAGFALQGMADTLPPDAGFSFSPDASAQEISDSFEVWLKDESLQEQTSESARLLSPKLTWDRCVTELNEWCTSGTIQTPFRLWQSFPQPL